MSESDKSEFEANLQNVTKLNKKTGKCELGMLPLTGLEQINQAIFFQKLLA